MNESSKYNTFFDLGLSEHKEKNFAKLSCEMYLDKKKKRVVNNELVKKYFSDQKLSKADLEKIKKILDGSIYDERKKIYSHCKLCSDSFERIDLVNYSKNFKYWNVCIPTFPYFPLGMMVYLKDIKQIKIENLQDLPLQMFFELLELEQNMYNCLNDAFDNKIVGINILFNQLSKSELCIHGHVEPMLMDIDTLNLGCKFIDERPFDKFSEIINSEVLSSKVIKLPEGIRIPLDDIDSKEALLILKFYENTLKKYFEKGKKLQLGECEVNDNIDYLLYNNMIPAATNSIYLTFYNDKYMLSSVPQITSDFVAFNKISDNPTDLYSLCINRNYTDRNDVFFKNNSPLVRPSIKIYDPNHDNQILKNMTRKMYVRLEK